MRRNAEIENPADRWHHIRVADEPLGWTVVGTIPLGQVDPKTKRSLSGIQARLVAPPGARQRARGKGSRTVTYLFDPRLWEIDEALDWVLDPAHGNQEETLEVAEARREPSYKLSKEALARRKSRRQRTARASSNPVRNSDARVREAERRYRQTGTTEDHAAWLAARLSAGELEPERIEWAARLGHPAAMMLEPEADPVDWKNFDRQIEAFVALDDKYLVVAYAVDFAKANLPIWESERPGDTTPHLAIQSAVDWMREPGEKHRKAASVASSGITDVPFDDPSWLSGLAAESAANAAKAQDLRAAAWSVVEGADRPLDSRRLLLAEYFLGEALPETPLRNSDARVREAERRYRQTGTTEDHAAWLAARLSAGELEPERIEWAARLGHPAALMLEPGVGLVEWRDQDQRQEAISRLDKRAVISYASDVTERVLSIWEEEYPDDMRPRQALELARSWVGNPNRINAYLSIRAAAPARIAADSTPWGAAKAVAWAASTTARSVVGERVTVFVSDVVRWVISAAAYTWDAAEEEMDWQRLRLAEYFLGEA